MSGAAGILPAMFDIEPVPREKKIHQSELPVELCEQLIEYFTKEGEVVFDEFAGSGALGIAALKKGSSSILLFNSAETVGKMKGRVEKYRKCSG